MFNLKNRFIYRLFKVSIFVATLLLTIACDLVWTGTEAYSYFNGALFSARNLNYTDHLILVVFSDNTINSIKNTASPLSYRQRGNHYAVSSWSERITDGLAKDYGLIKINDWPITQVDVRCVVYRIPGNTSITAIITSLSKDHRIEFVQRMNTFTSQTH